MKAAVLRNLHKDLEIVNLEIPKIEYGQVLVKNKASGICGAQLNQKRE